MGSLANSEVSLLATVILNLIFLECWHVTWQASHQPTKQLEKTWKNSSWWSNLAMFSSVYLPFCRPQCCENMWSEETDHDMHWILSINKVLPGKGVCRNEQQFSDSAWNFFDYLSAIFECDSAKFRTLEKRTSCLHLFQVGIICLCLPPVCILKSARSLIAWKSRKCLGNKWSLHLIWLQQSWRISNDISSLIRTTPWHWESSMVFHQGMTDHDSGGECTNICQGEPSWGKCQPTNTAIEAIWRWTLHQWFACACDLHYVKLSINWWVKRCLMIAIIVASVACDTSTVDPSHQRAMSNS